MLLTVLDPSGQHAEDYYDAAYAAVFGGLLQNVTVSTDATFYTTWLEEFLNQFIDYYNANQKSEPTDVSSRTRPRAPLSRRFASRRWCSSVSRSYASP
jgi:hypothetical protein